MHMHTHIVDMQIHVYPTAHYRPVYKNSNCVYRQLQTDGGTNSCIENSEKALEQSNFGTIAYQSRDAGLKHMSEGKGTRIDRNLCHHCLPEHQSMFVVC